jgi:large subunit ribosomal protein L2
MVGNCISLVNIPIGTWVHNIEWNPGQGAKSIRAARTFAHTYWNPSNKRVTPNFLV